MDEHGKRKLACFCGNEWKETKGAKAAEVKGVSAVRCDVCNVLINSDDLMFSCLEAHHLCVKCHEMEVSTTCICGERAFQVMRAADVYHSHQSIRCNGCGIAVGFETKVYHCQMGFCKAHPTAIDLCVSCMKERQATVSTLIKDTTEAIEEVKSDDASEPLKEDEDEAISS